MATTGSVSAANTLTSAPYIRLARGSGLSASAAGSSFTSIGWTVGGTNSDAISNNDYATFQIAPDSGYLLTVTSFAIRVQRSGTGPTNWFVRASHDNFTSNLAQWATTGTSASDHTHPIAGLNSLTGVEFRVYGYRAGAAGGSGRTPMNGANFGSSGIDLAVFGTACSPVSHVRFVQQTNYYTKFTDGGDIFNEGATNIGMWANTGNKQVVAWRNFRTDGSGGGDLRDLQPGDRFRVTVRGYSPYGILGVSINDGASTGSWANRHSNTRGYIEAGNMYGDLYVTDANGSPSWSGVRPWDTSLTLVFDILSSKEFTANVEGQTPKHDLTMQNSPGDDDRVDGFSLYYNDDWNGSANVNAYWAQDTMVTNLGYVLLGADNGTRNIVGKITDSTDPACTDTASPNLLIKMGTGTVTLQHTTNTYSSGTRIEGGTLAIFHDGSLGAVPGSATPKHIDIYSSGTLRATNSFTISANRGIGFGDVDGPSVEVDSGKTLTYGGVFGGNAGWNKKGSGSLALTGTASTNNGKVSIQAGTLQISDDRALGAVPGSSAEKINIWDAGTLEATETFTLSAYRLIEVGTVNGPKVSVASDKTLTYAGKISGSANWSKEGAGTLVLSSNSTASGTLTVNAGTAIYNGTNTSQTVSVGASSFLYGSGSVGALTINGQASAGTASNTVGSLRATSLTLPNNGRMQVNFSAMTGTAGTDWDVISVNGGSGTYTVSASAGNEFVIALKGNPTFNNTQGYTNIIVDAGTASGFASNKFTVSTDEFVPGLGGGSFVVDASGGDLRLIFKPALVAAPIAIVLGTNGAAIANGDNTPTAADGTDFGSVLWSGTFAVTNTFSITNAGNAALTISAVTTNSGMGAAGDFLVLSFPATVDAGAISNLVIAFNPTAVGVRTAAVVIANNDSTNNPYSFAVAGVGSVTNPTVSTTIASATNLTSATSGGNVTDDGGASVTLRGVVWGTASNPTVGGAGQSTNGTGTGSFTSTLTNLVPGQTYYYRAYAQNSVGTSYGSEHTLITPCFSTIVTNLRASVTNDVNFTAAWDALDLATGYRLDVATNATFSTTGSGDVFEESMGTGGSNGDSISTHESNDRFDHDDLTMSGTGDMRNTSTSSGYTGASGSFNVMLNTLGEYFIIAGINTVGSSNMKLYYGIRKNSTSEDGSGMTVEASTNGSSWVSCGTVSLPTGAGTATWHYRTNAVPASMEGATNLQIRFTSGNSVEWRLDDVKLTADVSVPDFVPGYSNRAVSGTSESVTGLTEDVTYYFRVRGTSSFCTTENSATAMVTTVVLPSTIDVLGNSVVIADGSVTPQISDHTDFGAVGLMGTNFSRTYTITNAGPGVLRIFDVSLSGAHAADFSISSAPATTVLANAQTTFEVRFNPSVVGTRTATVTVSNNVSGKTLYDFVVQGTGVPASLVRGPASLSVTSVVGSAPSGSFGVTNEGLGFLFYGTTTNASWLSVSPVGGTNDAGESRQHTLTFNPVAMTAGVHNATVTIADANAVGSPQTVTVEWTLTAIPSVLSAGVTNDGKELVRIGWTKDAGYDVMIVHNQTNAPAVPANGTAYSVGSAYGGDGSRVIYKGSGSSLEHVVPPGSDNYYAFYSVNGNYYSDPVSANVAMETYSPTEIVEPFAYTSLVTMVSRRGGAGFGTNFWIGATNDFSISQGSFAGQTNYPAPRANKLVVTPPSDTNLTLRRQFTNWFGSGRIYVSYIVNFQYDGAGKYVGLQLMSNTTERLFVGEVSTADLRLGIDGSSSNRVMNNGTGNDYIVILRYDWSTGLAAANAYEIGVDAVPDSEPAVWDMMLAKASNTVGRINGIRLASGTTGSGTPGDTYFDEIRVATNWNDLIQIQPSRVIYDGFGASSGSLSGGSGGTGWSDTWALGGNGPFADYSSGSFAVGKSSYFTPTGHKVVLYGDVDDRTVTAERTFLEAQTNGTVYVSWIMNYEFNGSDKWAGLSLLQSGTEKAFIGKVSGGNKLLGIDSSSVNSNATDELENGTGNDYVIVVKYDFATRELSATSFELTTESIAEEPTGYWQVTTTQTLGHITSLTGVRLNIGGTAGTQIGDVYYDEVRVGTNWYEVARKDGELQSSAMANGPIPRLLYVGTNYNPSLNPQGDRSDITVYDADLVNLSDPLDIAVLWSNQYGVFLTNANGALNIGSRNGRVVPNYDPVVISTQELIRFGFDAAFTNYSGMNGSLVVTTYQHRAFSITNSTYDDTYFITLSAENNNLSGGSFAAANGADDVPYWRALTVNTALEFFVQDDDINYPEIYEFTIDGVGGSGVSNLIGGAVAIIGVNGTYTGTADRFSFVVLSPFPSGTRFYFTDCGWDPVSNWWFRPTEFHTNEWVAVGNADVGQVFELSLENINNAGDQVVIYQYDGVGSPSNDPNNVRFIYAVNMGPRWYDPPGDPIPNNNESSALYRGLTNGVTAVSVPIGSRANVLYSGPTTGTASYLLSQISDSSNWISSTNDTMAVTNFHFKVTGAGNFDWVIPQLTDAQVREGTYWVTNVLQDLDSGVLATNSSFSHAPYFMLFNTNGDVVVSNLFTVSFSNSVRTLITNANDGFIGAYEMITLGDGEALVAYSDTDNDRANDWLSITSTVPIFVVDDDSDPPAVGSGAVEVMLGNASLPKTGRVDAIAVWNFNNVSAMETVSHGAGTMVNSIATTNDSAGTSVNAFAGDLAGRDITISGGANIGRYISFTVDMSGRKDLVVSFAAQRSGTGYDSNNIEVAIGNGPFTTVEAGWLPGASFATKTVDLSANTNLNNAASVTFRIVFGVDTASGGGNNRFDNFQFNANYITYYEVTDGQLASVGATNPLHFSFNAYDSYSGLARGTANDGTNMAVTIDGFATNNTADFQAAMSSAASTNETATNLWSFASMSYAQVGDLYGDGTNMRPIRATMHDADNDRIRDSLWVSNALFGMLRVIDDDSNTPVVVNLSYSNAAATPFLVLTNGGTFASSETVRGLDRRKGTSTNMTWTVTDGDLAASGAIGLQFAFGARDVHTGVGRGNSGTTNTVMSFSLGDVISGNFSNYSAALSSAQVATNQVLTNIWDFGVGAFEYNYIGTLMATNIGVNPLASTTRVVRVTIPDLDDDRPNDSATLYSAQVGFVRIIDDDARGPIIASAIAEGASLSGTNFLETFESSQGWTNVLSFSGAWTYPADNGTYIAEGNVLWGSLNPKVSGTKRIGLLTTNTQTSLQLPPIEDAGNLTVFAGRFGGEDATNDVLVSLDWRDGSSWVSFGTQTVSALNPEFEMLSWVVNRDGITTLRISRVSSTGPQVYMDDINVTPISEWISTNQLVMRWTEGVDDYSSVDEYRLVVPMITNRIPTVTNAGIRINTGTTNHTASILGQQGVITGFVFAVDDDDDRPSDRAMGSLKPIIVRVDTNPPPLISAFRATDAANDLLFDPGIDESSEIKVEWTPGGASAAQAAGWRQADSEPLSPWDTYIIRYYEVHDTNGVPVDNAITTTLDRTVAAWSNVLNNWAFTNLVLSNLQFDAYYKIELSARDEAGNIGSVTSVIGNTDRFLVTQGVTRVNMGLDVRWTGPTNEMITRDYDVIYVDSANGFRASLSNSWDWLAYTNHPRFQDYGGTNRVAPGLLTGTTYRLYRVAKENRWRTNVSPRVASVEIYAAKGLRLHPGENWYSLFSLPDPATTNEVESTVAYTFGTNTLPAGSSYATSARIAWFGPTIGATNFGTVATSVVWLSQSAGWQYSVGGSGAANSKRVPLGQGFMIELPLTASPTNLVLIGRVATQALVRTIPAPMSTNAPEYHLLSQQMTERITVADFMKQFGSFGAGYLPGAADELRVLSNVSTNGVSFGSLRQPRLRIYKSLLPAHAAAPWRYVDGGGSAMSAIIEPDDAIFILRRSPGADIVFTNAPTYPPPTRTMSP
ncbi:MAG: choice-of-anchor D domain-containing protein [Kiritimatiellae bacterium]|nr:choice-of-anchor D domain-containing protein [Kiritimatiellia bacterium]